MKTTVNKDGSVTTSDEDERQSEAKVASSAESKVVAPEDEKPTPKSRSKAESK